MVNRNSLGIDISADRVNLALLKQDKNGAKLLKAASGPLPERAVVDGNIEDPTALAAAIKNLVSANKMRVKHITISLFARPVLTQVIDLPKRIPDNIGQYVQSEVKHCAVLPVKNIAVDYCGISLSGRQENKRLFVVAAENEKIALIARALSRVGLDLDAVEPAVVASTRALYAKKIAEEYDSNVLIAVVNNMTVNFCVFRRQMFDFIRCKNLGEVFQPSGPAFERFVEQVNAIIQFYDIDVPDNPGHWKMVVAFDGPDGSAEGLNESLRTAFSGIDVHLSLPQNVCEDAGLVEGGSAEETSLAAVGLAMKPLKVPSAGLRVNLLSQEAASIKSAKKLTLLTANVAGVVLMIMILSIGLLNLKVKKVGGDLAHQQQKQPSYETQELIKQQELVSGQFDAFSEKLEDISQFLQLNKVGDWDKILEDIRSSTPKSVRITRLLNLGDLTITLEGQALSYEGINLFGDMLVKSSYIDSTALVGTGKNDADGLIMYSIDCSLAEEKGS